MDSLSSGDTPASCRMYPAAPAISENREKREAPSVHLSPLPPLPWMLPLPSVLWGIGIFFFSLAAVSGASPYAAWESSVTPPATHPFPAIEPFDATYQFGWEGLRAGSADVHVSRGEKGSCTITASGGPNRVIRKLWEYQASYFGEAGPSGEVPSWFHMDEHISKGDLLSDAVFHPDSVFSCHRMLTEVKPWSETSVPEVRDLFAAMLFVRSQPLLDGDQLRLVVFPDQDTYLVDLNVVGRDTLTVEGKKVKAIKFTLRIQRVETRGAMIGSLKPHQKFHSGRVWMSDDQRRIPLRAEVDVFIGSVFGEMKKVTPSF